MVSPVKKLTTINGFKIGDSVYLWRDGSWDVEPSIIRRVGLAGFLVRGLSAVYYWHEENRTWRKQAEPKVERTDA